MEDYLTVEGVRVYHQAEGSGPAVVLLHGNGLSHGQWKLNIGPLSRYYRVYAPDLPGFGLSEKPDADYGVNYYVGFLRSYLDALSLPKATIVGNSMGGEVAALFASRHPGRVSGIVLSSPTGFVPRIVEQNKEMYNLYINIMVRSRGLYCRPMFYDSSAVKHLEDTPLVTDSKESHAAFIKNCRDIQQTDPGYTSALLNIEAPTLILWGRDDLLLPADYATKYKELIAGSKVSVFDQCGHMPNVEKAPEFNSAVLGFLATLRH